MMIFHSYLGLPEGIYILYWLVVLTILKSGKVLVNGKDYISDYHNIILVGGWPTHLEKYARQWEG